MITTSCPAAAALTTITTPKCSEDVGQIQKLWFSRLTDDKNAAIAISAGSETGSILKLASVQALLTAKDSTKLVVTPYVEAPTMEAGEARTSGGGNDSLNGIETIVGANPTTFTAEIRSQKQSVIKQIKELMGESKAHNLGAFFINENAQICGLDASTSSDSSTVKKIAPIPVWNLFVGDKVVGGLEAPDHNTISFSLAPNWSDDFVILTPEYNALTEVVVTE